MTTDARNKIIIYGGLTLSIALFGLLIGWYVIFIADCHRLPDGTGEMYNWLFGWKDGCS